MPAMASGIPTMNSSDLCSHIDNVLLQHYHRLDSRLSYISSALDRYQEGSVGASSLPSPAFHSDGWRSAENLKRGNSTLDPLVTPQSSTKDVKSSKRRRHPSLGLSFDTTATEEKKENDIKPVKRKTRLSLMLPNMKNLVRMNSLIDYEKKAADALEEHSAKNLEKLTADDAIGHRRRMLRKFVLSRNFDLTSMFFIATNGVFIGLQAEHFAAVQHKDLPFVIHFVQWWYCLFFLFELMLRMFALGCEFFAGSLWAWNITDLVIVTLSVFDMFFAALVSGDGGGTLAMMRLVRIIRIVRVVRMIRLIHFFRELRVLVLAIFSALRSLVWALLLLFFIMYVVACIMTMMVKSHEDHDTNDFRKVRKYWGTMGRSMLSLFMSISGGVSWIDVMEPLEPLGVLNGTVFICFVAFVQIAVLNVVTGVFCENAIKSASRDDHEVLQEQIQFKKMYVEKLKQLFNEYKSEDLDQITITDFEDKLNDEHTRAYFNILELDVKDARSLFKLLDEDGTGLVDAEEFVSGCMQLRGFAKKLDMATLHHDIRGLQQKIQQCMRTNQDAFNSVSSLLKMATSRQRAKSDDVRIAL